jgi:hypothetical protein
LICATIDFNAAGSGTVTLTGNNDYSCLASLQIPNGSLHIVNPSYVTLAAALSVNITDVGDFGTGEYTLVDATGATIAGGLILAVATLRCHRQA